MAKDAGRSAGREHGLRLIRAWTWTAGLIGAALTAALALVAANSFGGHQGGVAPSSVSAADSSGGVDNSVQPLPQAPRAAGPDSIAGYSQPPAAVSGGS